LIATSPGYLSDEASATAGATPVTVNFTLATTEVASLFFDDFESGTGQWLGEWGLADPAEGHDSANSLTDSPGGDYANYTDSSCVMANEVSLNNALDGTLSFWAKWEIENAWDCCRLEISTDGGSSWTALATQHTDVASGQGVQVPAGEPVFDGNQYTWVQSSVDLEPWLGETDVRFRFRLSSDSSTHRDGFYFDDFQIQVTRQVTAAVGSTPDRLVRGLTAYPNPFNPQTTLRFELTRSGPVQADVYDLQGQLVRRILQADLPRGRHDVIWDGRDERGAAAPSGVYFGRVEEANDRFREATQPGWLTDRGEVFITLGAPDEIFDSSSDLQDRGIRLIRWHYIGDRLTLDFVDESGFGRFRLTDRSRSDYLRVLTRLRQGE